MPAKTSRQVSVSHSAVRVKQIDQKMFKTFVKSRVSKQTNAAQMSHKGGLCRAAFDAAKKRADEASENVESGIMGESPLENLSALLRDTGTDKFTAGRAVYALAHARGPKGKVNSAVPTMLQQMAEASAWAPFEDADTVRRMQAAAHLLFRAALHTSRSERETREILFRSGRSLVSEVIAIWRGNWERYAAAGGNVHRMRALHQ